MKRVYIVTILAIIVVVGSLGGAYQFYFKAKIDAYRQHQTQLDQLDKRLTALETTFSGVKPDVLVTEWKQQVNPWNNALREEGQFFTIDFEEVPPVPEEVVSPRLYYEEQYNKMMLAIMTEAHPKQIPYTNFGVYEPTAIPNNTATRDEVRQWLRKLKFGQDMIRLFLDHKALAIYNIEVWPDTFKANGLLMKRTIGVQFVMNVSDLADFLEFLRTSERYYNVDAIRIANPYLLTTPPPPVTVDMLLTIGWFNRKVVDEPSSTTASASSFGSASEALTTFGIRSGDRTQIVQATGFKRWWRGFRRKWLPF